MTRTALIAGMAWVAALGASMASAQLGAVDPSQDAAWHNKQSLALAQLKASHGWQWMEGGLRWRRTKGDGSGRHPKVSDVIELNYAGTLIDGTEFDSTYARNEPAIFPLGALIPAWQLAVPMMGIGDTIEIAAPADLAYGTDGKGPIPGGATLLFKIELMDILNKEPARGGWSVDP